MSIQPRTALTLGHLSAEPKLVCMNTSREGADNYAVVPLIILSILDLFLPTMVRPNSSFAVKRPQWRAVPAKDEISLAGLRKAIPAELFQRSYAKSLGFLAFDLLAVYVTALTAQTALQGWGVPGVVVWPIYTFYQGLNFTALWVLAHECGHGGFSDCTALNDLTGFLLHSALGTPYFAWAETHAKHHRHTNDMDEGETWVPYIVSGPKSKLDTFLSTPLGAAIRIFITLNLGWYFYLINNTTGSPALAGASHFTTNSKLFKKAFSSKITASNAGLAVLVTGLALAVREWGAGTIACYYFLPHFVNMCYLVGITFMQHTDTDVAHFSRPEYTWLRGAVQTIDRTMGPFVDWRLHDIHSSHVVHHIFSDMPHYNATKATPYLAAALGKYYKRAERKVWGSHFLGYWVELCSVMKVAQAVRKSPQDGFFWFDPHH